MDIHQLRSWIFELYEPLENERQYIVFDADRGNLLIDAPPFSERALRLVRGAGSASLLVATNAARAADAARYREALGVQVAVHEEDAAGVPDGPDVVLTDDELLRPDARALRVRGEGTGATVVVLRKAGGVLVCGDLDLANDAAKTLLATEFSAILSARRPPVWNAGKEALLAMQGELPQPRKSFGIFLQAPWDRAYKGRLDDKMYPHDPIVPREATAPREAAMGPATLVVARSARDLVERPRRPAPAHPEASLRSAGVHAPAATTDTAPAPGRAAPAVAAKRPRPFAEDWSAPGTPRPPTTIANPLEAIATATVELRPRALGGRFARVAVEDLVGAPQVEADFWGGPDLAPDGSEVAFAWDRTGTMEIFSAPLVGERIFQLTDAKQRSVWPRWSPDGSQIAFLRDTNGDERFDVWLVDRDGEHERKLTDAPGLQRWALSWSPDGSSLLYTESAGKARGIFVMDARSGKSRAVTDGSYSDFEPRWSPDGRTIVFSSRREQDLNIADLYLVPGTGGEAVRLETRGGAVGEAIGARWSPDGSQLAFTTNTRGHYEIAIATLRDGTVARVERPNRTPFDTTDPVWRPDGRALLYLHRQDAELSIRRVFTASKADDPIADLPGVHVSPRIAPDSETVAYVYSGARRPFDAWVREATHVEPRAITTSLPGRVDPEALVEPVHLRYAGEDGLAIPALVYVPHQEAIKDSAPPPAIVYLHGGPTDQHLRRFDSAAQLFANNGYLVLAPNPRGSTGYGRAFQDAILKDWGGKDLGDVLRGVDWLVKQGLADGRRICVYGASYGGYLTLLALARAPQRFVAGVSVCGIVNLRTLYETTPPAMRKGLERMLGTPEGNAELYRDRSPLTHVREIRAPLLILQGVNDPRVPKAEADQVAQALHAAGRTYEYKVYEDEGHGFAKLPNRIDALRRTLDWFDRHSGRS